MKPDAKTKRNPTWTGPVYSEQFSRNNSHVFESPYEFQYFIEQEASMDQFLEKPDYVWATKLLPPVRMDWKDAQYIVASSSPLAIPKSIKKLEAAINEFNADNARPTLGPDYSTIVPLQWLDPAPKKSARPQAPPEDE